MRKSAQTKDLFSYEEDEILKQKVHFNPHHYLSLDEQRKKLILHRHRLRILAALETHRVVIILGQPSSGKSTQIPQYLFESGWICEDKRILCVMNNAWEVPSIANRVAQEMRETDDVGFVSGFDVVVPLEPRILFLQDSDFLRVLSRDPLLNGVSVVILDGIHERTVAFDLACGLLKKIMGKRRHLRLILTTSTPECIETFEQYFQNSHMYDEILPGSRWDRSPRQSNGSSQEPPLDWQSLKGVAIVSAEMERKPVDIIYLSQPAENFVILTARTAKQIFLNEGSGNILAFLPGNEEVEECVEMLRQSLPEGGAPKEWEVAQPNCAILALYSALSPDLQFQVYKTVNPQTRKIIISTSIAETSASIPDIRFVIDCGFKKVKCYNLDLGGASVDCLHVSRIAKSTSQLRTFKIASEETGKCFRLYREIDFDVFSATPVPEALRSDLTTTILLLKSFGIDEVAHFDFPTAPSQLAMTSSLERLFALQCIDDHGNLTHPLGELMAELPVHPALSKFILSQPSKASEVYSEIKQTKIQYLHEALTAVAVLLAGDIWIPTNKTDRLEAAKRGLASVEGDLVTYNTVYEHWLFYEHEDRDWTYRHFINHSVMERARHIRRSLEIELENLKVEPWSVGEDVESFVVAAGSAFFLNTATFSRSHYTLARNQEDSVSGRVMPIQIDNTSVMFGQTPSWIIFVTAMETTREGKLQCTCRGVTRMDPKLLPLAAPHYFKLQWAEEQGTKEYE